MLLHLRRTGSERILNVRLPGCGAQVSELKVTIGDSD
jgi:hypothetical protein